MPTIGSRHVLAGLFSMIVVASAASAQRAGQPNTRYLEQKNAKTRILDIEVRIQAWDNTRRLGPKETLEIDRWSIQQAFIVFPMAMSSASHKTQKATGTVEFDDHDADTRFQMESRFPAGANYGVWIFEAPKGKPLVAREMELQTSMTVTSYDTIFHEDEAREVEWPQKDFPDILKSTFERIPYLDYDPAQGDYDIVPIQDLIKRWTDGNDPKTIKPVELAKWLAGNVVQHVQVTGQGLAFPKRGPAKNRIEGVQLQPPVLTATRKRGSQFDIAMLLVAVYREVGLPARIVCAYGLEDEDDEKIEFLKGRAHKELRAWVEFALYDERDGTVTWIPVDPAKMRANGGSRIRNNFMRDPQKFFGTHDELDSMVPFTFHFFPPTTVHSYSASNAPGFWGWFVAPQAPDRGAFQSITFNLKSASVSGKDRGN